MKNIIIAFVVIAVVALVISAMNTNKTELKLSDVKADEVTDSYWNTYSKAYMDACVSVDENISYAYCSCTLNEMESKYGRAKVIEISLKFAEDKIMPKELFDAAAVCSDK